MPKPLLETQNLTIGYPARRGLPRLISESIHVRLEPGELVCLLGPNGVGKSTLLRTLAGMQPPLHGQVRVAGADVYRLPPRQLARCLSVVLTDRAEVGALSVRTVVALGRYPYTDWTGRLTAHDEAVVDKALAAVGIAAFAPRSVHELSDGERQKVLIARALAQEPQLLLLDEPTAFLDLPRRVELMAILRRLTRQDGRAVLLSTHDLELALRSADQLWLFQPDGSIRVGAPEELVLEGALQAAFHSEGVAFDPHTGAFTFPQPSVGQVDVVGDDLAALWTRRALEREGFTVNGHDTQHRSAIRVEILETRSQPQPQDPQRLWRIQHGESCRDYPTLAQALRGVKACSAPSTPPFQAHP